MLKMTTDIDGTKAVSTVLLNLLNEFPALSHGKKVEFASLSDSGGIGFFPTAGAILQSNTESITGKVRQVCLYPFNVIYRAALKSESQRLHVKEFLDTLGKWLEQQEITVDGIALHLSEYPPLASGNRKITSIERVSPACLNAAYDDGVEDWTVSIKLIYKNEFYK